MSTADLGRHVSSDLVVPSMFKIRSAKAAVMAAGRVLTTAELRQQKLSRTEFLSRPRRPITVVLDGVRRSYNIGAIFRLCDAFLIERLIVCGTDHDPKNRKFVQAARGTQGWVPWTPAANAWQVVVAAKQMGAWLVAAEQTTENVGLDRIQPSFPAVVVFGSESAGVSQQVIDHIDCAVAIPMLGMANSLNVSTAAAIVLHGLAAAADRCRRLIA